MAADMAETRSSSTPPGRDEAMISPSTDTTAEASTSVVFVWSSRNRLTSCSLRALSMNTLHPAGKQAGSLTQPPGRGKLKESGQWPVAGGQSDPYANH